MAKKLIFISCGQQTEEEKALGLAVKETIDSTDGFESYFAETVHDLDSLGKNIFESLLRCSGMVAFLHNRGTVIRSSGETWGVRSSVWVNQELAILAYRQFFEATSVPVLPFRDRDVNLEGAMTALIANPLPITNPADILDKVRSWLARLDSQSTSVTGDDSFDEKWKRLTPTAIKVLACLIDEGGEQVNEMSVQRALVAMHKFSRNNASAAVQKSKLEFINTNLVKLVHNIQSGDEMSLHPTWEWHLRRAVAKWNSASKKS